jgi:ribosomal protein S18 acetylase RimI-like enzyme
MFEIQIQPFNLAKENELFQFSHAHSWKPSWSEGYVKEFIQLLTSSPDLIFDLYFQNERIAAAVLVDKTQNKGNNALFEFIGVDKRYNSSQIYAFGIEIAKERLPKNRSGIEVTVHESFHEVTNLLSQQGFTPYYDIVEMICDVKVVNDIKQCDDIYPLTEEDYTEFYHVMAASFKDNVEIWIPSYDDGKSILQDCQTWVYKKSGKIIGFLIVADIKSGAGEIRAIGVLSDFRGKGIGRQLLSHALYYFAEMDIPTCFLSANNRSVNALLNLGFTITDQYTVYCWKTNKLN